MKLTRSLSALLAGALVALSALVVAAPAQAAAGDIHTYNDLNVMAAPSRVLETPDGSVWVVELLAGYIHQYDRSGAHLNVYGPFGFAAHGASDATIGPDGRIWVTQFRSIDVFSTSGTLAATYDLRGTSPAGKDLDPGTIVTSSGMVWFRASGFDGVVGMTPAGTKVFVSAPFIGGLSAAPDGRIWAGEIGSQYIGYIDPVLGTYSRLINPDGRFLTSSIAAAPDGTVWVTSGEFVYNVSFPLGVPTWTKYATPDGFPTNDITVAPDGTLWAGLTSEKLMAIFTDGIIDAFGPTKGDPEQVSIIGDRIWYSGGERLLGAMELLVPPTLTTCPTPTGTVGTAYSSGALPTTGSDPKRFSTVIGSVPPGLTLDTATGALTGTPTVAGTHVFTLRVTGSMGMREAAYDKRCVVTIAPAPAMAPVLGPLVEGGGAVAGVAYSATVTATGAEPMTLTVTSGSLPTGVTLATSGRVAALNGAPSTAGTYDFEITATNADGSNTRAYRIVVAPSPAGPPVLGGLVESGAAVTGAVYSATVTAAGDEPMTFASTTGSLPPGITLTSTGRVATLSGTPTTAGSYTFSLTATNAAGADTKSYRIVVAAAAVAPTLPAASWPAVQVNAPFSQTLTATGDEPMAFAVSAGTLPPGLALTSAGRTVTVSGTPTAVGDTDVEITASNAAGSDAKTYRISVTAAPPAPVLPTLGEATWTGARVGDPFDASIAVTGTTPVDVRITAGTLPAGLTLARTTTGVGISGTPISAGPAEFTLTATNAAGEVSREYRITVEALAVTPGSGGVGGTTPGASGGAAAGGAGGTSVTGPRPGTLASTGLGAGAGANGLGGAPQLVVGALALALAAAGAAAVAAAAGRHRVFTVRSGAERRGEG